MWFTVSIQGNDKTTSVFSGEIGIFDVVQVCGFKAAGLTVKVCLRSGMLSVKLILILRTVSYSRWRLQTIRNLLSRISDSSFLFGSRQTLGRLMVLGLGQGMQYVVTDVNRTCRAMKIGLEELNLLFVSSFHFDVHDVIRQRKCKFKSAILSYYPSTIHVFTYQRTCQQIWSPTSHSTTFWLRSSPASTR